MFDQLDYKILKELNQNGRASASEIARRINAHPRTVRKRIEDLINSGAVQPTVVVDPEKFGYVTSADIFLEVDSEVDERIVKYLCDLPEVSYVAYGFGSNEVSIEARFKSNAELLDFIKNHLSQIEGVKVTRYVLVPRILKNAHQWLPYSDDFDETNDSGDFTTD